MTKSRETPENRRQWIALRKRILAERGRKCQECERICARVHVDHIKPWSEYSELRFDPDNLQVLCTFCHKIKTADEGSARYERKAKATKQLNQLRWELTEQEFRTFVKEMMRLPFEERLRFIGKRWEMEKAVEFNSLQGGLRE